MIFFVYILRSLKDFKLYIGQTNNLSDRIRRHNEGFVRATRTRRPFELVHSEIYTTRAEAMQREKYLKALKNPKYIKEHIIERQKR